MPWWSSEPFGSEAAPDSFSTDAEPIPYQYRTGNTPVPHRAHRKLAAAATVKIERGRLSGRALLRTTWKSEIVKLQTQNDSIMPLASAHLHTLNTEQRRAVEHGVSEGNCASGGPLLVIAGAGSGKTNTLAHRVAHLIVNGADPRRILLMTFSRRAASEMTRRVAGIAQRVNESAKTNSLANALTDSLSWAGTFHAIGARLLREHAEDIGLAPAFTIHDREDAADLMNLVRHE